tara:strand:- start:523 stop:672 length:150 start_codon:yes stop_codon:yes gene_type:complete
MQAKHAAYRAEQLKLERIEAQRIAERDREGEANAARTREKTHDSFWSDL